MRIQKAGLLRQAFSPGRRAVGYILLSAFTILLTGLWFVFSIQSAIPPAPTKVVAGGDQSPVGGVFTSSGTPALGLGISGPSGAGSMAFWGTVTEGSAPLGIFLSIGNNLTKVAAVGDPTPLGGTFSFLSMPVQNQVGQMAFGATIKDGSAPEGIFLVSGGQTTKVAAVGEGTPLGVISSISSPLALNNHGEVAFGAAMTGESASQGIFIASGGSLSKVVAKGDPTPVGGSFSLAAEAFFPAALNDAGTVAFGALLAGVSAPQGISPAQGIFLAPRGGSITKVVAVGDPTPLGGTFLSFTAPALNNAGEVVFGATLANGAVSQGIFLVSRGQITPVVADGDLTPVGGTFALAVGVSPSPALNDRGEVAFGAGITGRGSSGDLFAASGIFLFSGGQISKVVDNGDLTPLGGTFLGSKPFVLSNAGTLLFMSSVDVNGDGNPDNQGIFSVKASVS